MSKDNDKANQKEINKYTNKAMHTESNKEFNK